MRRKTVSGIMLSLLLIGMLILTFNIQPVKAEPTTIIVPDDYTTIQAAINVASDGDTIFVRAGTYYENVTIEKSISLIGEDKYNTIADGRYVSVSANNVNITGFTARSISVGGTGNTIIDNIASAITLHPYGPVYGGGRNTIIDNLVINSMGFYTFGINLYVVDNNEIINNKVLNYTYGIRLYHSRSNVIKDNEVLDNQHGIILEEGSCNNTIYHNNVKNGYSGVFVRAQYNPSNNNIISGNNITNNKYGIYLDDSSNNTVSGNTANNNNYHGIFLYSSENNLIIDNLVENSGYDGIFLNFADNNLISNNTCEYNGWHGIRSGIELHNSENNLISNNTCSSNYDRGISLSHSDHNTISYNICEDNYYHGIHLDYSSSNTISNNTCEHNGNGINLGYSSSNTISNNTCEHNAYNGIGLYDSSNYNSISRNKITNNWGVGIGLFDSSNYNSISGNNITANNENGIWLMWSSNYNIISGNNITATIKYNGIGLHESSNNTISENNITNNIVNGVWLGWSSNNKFFHNNFINNGNQVSSYMSVSIWDDGYPSGGNYWSGHACIGNPSDGSQPYIIDVNNIDHYPFQDPNGWLLHQLTVTSSPITGITFTIDGVPQATPYTEWLLEGSYTLIMPETHNGYVWSHWLEDGDTNRIKTILLQGTTWTAVYEPAPKPVGGKATPINIPMNRPETPTLWIWLTTTILSLVLAGVYVKKRKRNTRTLPYVKC